MAMRLRALNKVIAGKIAADQIYCIEQIIEELKQAKADFQNADDAELIYKTLENTKFNVGVYYDTCKSELKRLE